MIDLAIVVLSVVLPLVHLALSRAPRTKERVVRVLLLYALVLDVGVIGFVFGFIPHVFFPDQAAKMIGWSPSPFQFEVGFHDGAWGILGFLCIWLGGLFWLATGLGWSLFMLGPHPPDRDRRQLRALQFSDDLFGRLRRDLAAGAALSPLPVRRVSATRIVSGSTRASSAPSWKTR